MNIWILAKKNKFESYENKRFAKEARKRKIKLTLVSPEDIEILEPQQKKEKILYQNREIDFPDGIIPRMGSGTNYFGLAILRQFEMLHIPLLNAAQSIENSKDKLRAIQLLSQNNIPIPKTMLGRFPMSTDFIRKEFRFPVVVKIISGSEGKGIVLCENKNQLQDILDLTEQSSEGKQNIIIQEFISESRGRDIRVLVIGGRAIGAMLRKGKKGSFKSNFSAGGTVELFPLNSDLEWIAVQSAQAVGLDIAGVDILMGKDEYKVSEVNSAPYFEGFEASTGINVPEEIFHFLQLRINT